jgi:hypothetical protein
MNVTKLNLLLHIICSSFPKFVCKFKLTNKSREILNRYRSSLTELSTSIKICPIYTMFFFCRWVKQTCVAKDYGGSQRKISICRKVNEYYWRNLLFNICMAWLRVEWNRDNLTCNLKSSNWVTVWSIRNTRMNYRCPRIILHIVGYVFWQEYCFSLQ